MERKIVIIIASIAILFSSCIKNKTIDDTNTDKSRMENLVISDGFTFDTAKDLDVRIYDNSSTGAMYQIYALHENESSQHTASGVSISGVFQKKIRIPAFCEKLLVVKNIAGKKTRKIVPIAGNDLEIYFDENAKTANSCTDLLYTVNNVGLLYTINLDDYSQVVIDTLPFSGSNACAVDTINRRVYTSGKDNPRPLYYYDLDAETWVFVANMNQSWVRMDYNHVTNKIYGGSGNKIYIVDPITGAYDATYTISGLHSTTGGDIVVTPQGSIFVCTFSGLYHLDLVGSSYQATRISAENLEITPTSMAFDREMNLYLGSTQWKLVMMDTADGAYQVLQNLNYKINDLGSLPCSVSDLANIDTDGDGIIDDLDDYPNDSVRAFESYTPSQIGWGSLTFEDLWPYKGDNDFNDLTMNYRFIEVSNSQNMVVELIAKLKINNIGASYRNGFGIEFPFSSNIISQATGFNLTESLITTDSKGLEANQANPVVIVFDNAFENQDDTLSIVISFNNPVASAQLGSPPYNPFIFIDSDRGRELHLSDHPPTSLVNSSYLNSGSDASNLTTGAYYKTQQNHPWALDIIHEIRVPLEKTDINQAYNYFSDWAESSGTTYADWYKDNPGYRNTSQIKQ